MTPNGIDVRHFGLRRAVASLLEKFKQCPNDPESKSVETGMQTHSNCIKNKNNDVRNCTTTETSKMPTIVTVYSKLTQSINQLINQSINQSINQ